MIAPRIASRARAFFTSGGVNAVTPSATASMPVSATAPEANARRTRNAVRPARGSPGPAGTAAGRPSRAYRTKPTQMRGQGKEPAGLAHAAQVPDGNQADRDDAEHDPVGEQRRHGGGQRRHARGDAHRDRQRVVDEQRPAGGEG